MDITHSNDQNCPIWNKYSKIGADLRVNTYGLIYILDENGVHHYFHATDIGYVTCPWCRVDWLTQLANKWGKEVFSDICVAAIAAAK